jgi:hypothetical protein
MDLPGQDILETFIDAKAWRTDTAQCSVEFQSKQHFNYSLQPTNSLTQSLSKHKQTKSQGKLQPSIQKSIRVRFATPLHLSSATRNVLLQEEEGTQIIIVAAISFFFPAFSVLTWAESRRKTTELLSGAQIRCLLNLTSLFEGEIFGIWGGFLWKKWSFNHVN